MAHGQAFRPAQANVNTLGLVTDVEYGQSAHHSAGVDSSSMAKTQDKVRGNGLGVKAFIPLHLKLHGMARNRTLNGESCSVAEESGVDDEERFSDSAKSFTWP
jgi:hypothetical protein